MTSMPAWLRIHLETTTGLDYTNARGRYATPHRCRKCRALILTGLDSDTTAIRVTVDPTPLNPQQELACTITGRKTFFLEQRGQQLAIDTRTRWHIAGMPAGSSTRFTVVPAHQCGARFPDPPAPPRTYLADPDPPPPF